METVVLEGQMVEALSPQMELEKRDADIRVKHSGMPSVFFGNLL